MAFLLGARVHLSGLGTGIIREVRSGGRYAVEIRGRLVIAELADLEVADPPRHADRRRDGDRTPSRVRPSAAARGTTSRLAAPGCRCASLDLHGTTVAEARDAIEVFVNAVLLEGGAQARVIHGRSGGRVKAAVHQYLRGLSAVASFRLDPQNPGVTLVEFV